MKNYAWLTVAKLTPAEEKKIVEICLADVRGRYQNVCEEDVNVTFVEVADIPDEWNIPVPKKCEIKSVCVWEYHAQ